MSTRALALALAARLDCDPRTAERLLTEGPSVIRSRRIRERAPAVLAELGITPPSTRPEAA